MKALPWCVFAAINHGKVLTAPEHDASTQSEADLLGATEQIAQELEEDGIPCERTDCPPLSLVNTLTNEVIPVRLWRNISILPAVLIPKRRRDALELEAFCKTLPRQRLRMRLVTSGPRCPVDEVGDRIGFLLDKFRRLGNRKWFATVADLVSVGIEFPVVRGQRKRVVRNRRSQLLYHVHAHCIFRLKRWLSDKEWADFHSKWHAHFGTYCPDSGVVRDLREACKYPIKAADLAVVRASGELTQLYYQLRKRHLFQPYGQFRAWRRELRRQGQKVKRIRRPDQAPELVLVERQPSSRAYYRRDRPSRTTPQDIFLGWRLPRATAANPTMAVGELWMGLRSTPEDARRKRHIKAWTPPEPQPPAAAKVKSTQAP